VAPVPHNSEDDKQSLPSIEQVPACRPWTPGETSSSVPRSPQRQASTQGLAKHQPVAHAHLGRETHPVRKAHRRPLGKGHRRQGCCAKVSREKLTSRSRTSGRASFMCRSYLFLRLLDWPLVLQIRGRSTQVRAAGRMVPSTRTAPEIPGLPSWSRANRLTHFEPILSKL
jgi:hypothetical protein